MKGGRHGPDVSASRRKGSGQYQRPGTALVRDAWYRGIWNGTHRVIIVPSSDGDSIFREPRNRDSACIQVGLRLIPGLPVRAPCPIIRFRRPRRSSRVATSLLEVYLDDSCVFEINGSSVIDTKHPGYRIVGKVIADAPYQGLVRGTGKTGDNPPE